MKTIEIAGKTYTVKFEFPNGAFYLVGPEGGCPVVAKEMKGKFYFIPAKGKTPIRSAGEFVTATREQLAA